MKKMNKGLKIGLIIGASVLAVGGGILLVRHFRKPDNTEKGDDTSGQIFEIEEEVKKQNSGNVEKKEDGTPKKDFNKKLIKGDKGEEVKSVQKLLNSIIRINRTADKQSDKTKEARRKKIADFEYLVEDGSFGNRTENLLIVVTGKKNVTVNELFQKQKDFTNAYK